MLFFRVAASALLVVFATACVNSANADSFNAEVAARNARETILSFDLFDYSGAVNKLGDVTNTTITVGISNGREFVFSRVASVPGSPFLSTAENGASSMVLVNPSVQDEREVVGRDSGEKLFRAMINDADDGVMYEFMPNVATGEMVVVARNHSDLPDSSDKVRQASKAIRQWRKFSNIIHKNNKTVTPKDEEYELVHRQLQPAMQQPPLSQASSTLDVSRFGCHGGILFAEGYRCRDGKVAGEMRANLGTCRYQCSVLPWCEAYFHSGPTETCLLYSDTPKRPGKNKKGWVCEVMMRACRDGTGQGMLGASHNPPVQSPPTRQRPPPANQPPRQQPTPQNTPAAQQSRKLQQPPTMQPPAPSFIGLMVVWTQRAECANAHPNWNPAPFPCNLTPRTEAAMLATVELAVAQSNAILQNSGVASRIRLVHAYRDNRYVESHVGGHDMFDTAVDAVTYTEDGIMDDVHTRRRQYGAQIVSMFVYDPSYRYCGMAWQGKNGRPVDRDRMFNAVDFRCATSRYDLLHEIGHLLGSKHDRGTKGVCTTNLDEIHYGYRHPQYPFRTVLAYGCKTREAQCDNSPHRNSRHGCSILPILSGPDSRIVVSDPWGRPMEITMGDEWNNNAQIFRVGLRQI